MKVKLLAALSFLVGLCVFDANAEGGRFQHPGIGLNREQLDQLKANVQGGVEPWKTLYDALTKHDHRFSKKPRIFARRGEGITQIDSPDFDNRCAWDSQTAYYQAIMYEITGEAEYRERAPDGQAPRCPALEAKGLKLAESFKTIPGMPAVHVFR